MGPRIDLYYHFTFTFLHSGVLLRDSRCLHPCPVQRTRYRFSSSSHSSTRGPNPFCVLTITSFCDHHLYFITTTMGDNGKRSQRRQRGGQRDVSHHAARSQGSHVDRQRGRSPYRSRGRAHRGQSPARNARTSHAQCDLRSRSYARTTRRSRSRSSIPRPSRVALPKAPSSPKRKAASSPSPTDLGCDENEAPKTPPTTSKQKRSTSGSTSSSSPWREVETPNGGKLRYTMSGRTRHIPAPAPVWVKHTLSDGRPWWRNVETGAASFTEPTNTRTHSSTPVAKGSAREVPTDGASSTAAVTPPRISPFEPPSAMVELQSLRKISDEAALWRTAEHNGQTYWYNQQSSQWQMPDCVKSVKSDSFKQRIAELQERLRQDITKVPEPVKESKSAPTLAPPQDMIPSEMHTGNIDLSKAVLKDAKEVQAAIAQFHDMCSRKQLSSLPRTSCHVSFAKPVESENRFISTLRAMGFKVIEDSTSDRDLPFAVPKGGSESMPTYRGYFDLVPADVWLTFEYNKGANSVSVKGARGTFIDKLPLLLAFWGRVSDVSGQRTGRASKPSMSHKQ